ncbi:MAG: Uncharacterized protein G01um1014106_57 [Parcubacteria group bacterium Gr01-1014_106]|nr:MAG: Uncharacterized protein G01um1014106_57 [Parcubacteria group bacterium Gr01-1014_106]
MDRTLATDMDDMTSSSPSVQDRKPDLISEASELVVCDAETAPVLCDTFVYEPETQEKSLGSLYVVIETVNLDQAGGTTEHPGASSARTLIDLVVSTLRAEYYRDASRDMLTSFEAALAATNETLARTAQRGLAEWLVNLHAAVAAIQNTTVHVTRVGNASVLLLRQGALTDIGEGLTDPSMRNPRATFTNVASGTVSEHDVLLLTSPQFFRHISKDRCASMLAGKSPKQASAYLRDLLAESQETPTLAGLFTRFSRAPIALPPLPRAPEAYTASPPPSAALGTYMMRRPAFRPPPPVRFRRRRGIAAFLQQGAHFIGYALRARFFPAVGSLFRRGADAARFAATKTTHSVPHLFSSLKEAGAGSSVLGKLRIPSSLPSAGALTTNVPQQMRTTMRNWPRSTKIFFGLTLLFAILFVGSVIFLRRKGIEDAAVRAASEKLQGARVQKDTADAALIYDNTTEARRLLREARDGATAVKATEYYHPEADQLLAAIQASEDKAEQVVRVTEPTRVGDFGSVAPDGRARGLAAIGSSLFAFHPETNAVFRLSVDNGETTTLAQTSQGIGYFRQAFAIPAEQMILFATDAPGLALFDTTRGDVLKQELTPTPEGIKDIRSIATFGSRLYLLLPDVKQIFGYSKTLAGYSGGASWLKDMKIPVDRAVSMGVDGYLYLLFDDGNIQKFLKGAPVEFAQAELTTPLSRDARLFINESLAHLYVLDVPNKRVVVYDTTGKVSKQLVFPNAGDLRDLAIGGKEETLYVLDGTAVFKVPLKEEKK